MISKSRKPGLHLQSVLTVRYSFIPSGDAQRPKTPSSGTATESLTQVSTQHPDGGASDPELLTILQKASSSETQPITVTQNGNMETLSLPLSINNFANFQRPRVIEVHYPTEVAFSMASRGGLQHQKNAFKTLNIPLNNMSAPCEGTSKVNEGENLRQNYPKVRGKFVEEEIVFMEEENMNWSK